MQGVFEAISRAVEVAWICQTDAVPRAANKRKTVGGGGGG